MFPTTRWSLVARAGENAVPSDRRRALEELCAAYWQPLYRFARCAGSSHHDASDLVQGLFERILARRDFDAVRQDRGRFRSWLLAAYRHHAAGERDRATAVKRGGRRTTVSLDDSVVDRGLADPAMAGDPETLYLREWALTVVERAVRALESEYRARGRETTFFALRPSLAGEGGTPYADLAARLDTTEGAIKIAVHRLRGRFREMLRREVEDTVADPAEIDDELRALVEALSGTR